MIEDKKDTISKRAKWEESYHKTFDYKQKDKLCLVCGEKDNRHTYTCIYYDTEK